MPKSLVETYTISAHPLQSSPTVSHVEFPTHGNGIKIIITEPTPSGDSSPSAEPNSTNNTTLTRIETPRRVPTIEIMQVSPSDTNRSRQTDDNSASSVDWITTENSSLTNSERYTEGGKSVLSNSKSTFHLNEYLPMCFI